MMFPLLRRAADGDLWIGTKMGCVHLLDRPDEVLDIGRSMPIVFLLLLGDDCLLVGQHGRLSIVRDMKVVAFAKITGDPATGCLLDDGSCWIGLAQGDILHVRWLEDVMGVSILVPTRGRVTNLIKVGTNKVWCIVGDSVEIYDAFTGQAVHQISFRDGESPTCLRVVPCRSMSHRRPVWVGQSGGWCSVWDPERFVRLWLGVQDATIVNISCISTERVWLFAHCGSVAEWIS